MVKVQVQERGWAGHFILANRCRFRRNTILTCKQIKIVVSSVGLQEQLDKQGFDEISRNCHFETRAFYAKTDDTRYHDGDVMCPVSFDSPWPVSYTHLTLPTTPYV